MNNDELYQAALDLLAWIDITEGELFRSEQIRFRNGRLNDDVNSSNAEHNHQVRAAIERLREALK